jgi:hypothetical protein
MGWCLGHIQPITHPPTHAQPRRATNRFREPRLELIWKSRAVGREDGLVRATEAGCANAKVVDTTAPAGEGAVSADPALLPEEARPDAVSEEEALRQQLLESMHGDQSSMEPQGGRRI